MATKLTVKQQRFVDMYTGNLAETAKLAEISYVYAKQLYTKSYYAHIQTKLKNREQGRTNAKIATRKERQEFWTDIMRGELEGLDRVKGSELLGRSEADFTDKTVFPGKDGEPQDIGMGSIEAAMRLNDLINKAVKAKKEGGK